ncbi:UbiA family prenyltransferase [bacterium]|nr:UbiA family prenyltransferase [bacterium]
MRFIKNIIQYLEEAKASFWIYALIVFAFIVLRNFTESLSNSLVGIKGISLNDYFLHAPFFYIGILLFICLFAARVLKVDFTKVLKVFVPFIGVINISPIVDFIATHGYGTRIEYPYFSGDISVSFRSALITFLTITPPKYISLGVTVEIYTLLVLCLIYAIIKSKNVLRIIIFFLLTYFTLYFYALFPNIMFIFKDFLVNSRIIARSSGGFRNFGLLYLVIYSFLLFPVFKRINARGYRSVLKKLHWHSVGHFIILFFIAAFLGTGGYPFRLIRVNIIGTFALVFSIFFCWLSALLMNDISDEKVDAVNDPDRPIPSGALSKGDAMIIAALSGFTGLSSALCVGFPYALIMMTLLSMAVIYSYNPLRIKKIPIIKQLTFGFASLLVFLAGYLFTLEIKAQGYVGVPLKQLIGVLFIFTISSSIRDIKDREGDKMEGILTIPVLFGGKAGKIITGLLLIAAYLSSGFFLEMGQPIFYLVAFLFGAANFIIIWRYKSLKPLYILYFIFVCLTSVVFMKLLR